MKRQHQEWLLFIGTTGIVVSLFLALMALLTIVKVSKLTLLCLMLLSSALFYAGVAPEIKARFKDIARMHFKYWWHKIDNYVNQTIVA